MFLHTRKFKKNLTVLALKNLDIGRNHTISIDTATEDIGGRVVDTVFHLIFQCRCHCFVIGTTLDNAIEHNRVVGTRIQSTILLGKCTDIIIALVRTDYRIGCCDCRIKCRIWVGVFHRTKNLRHRNLKYHVHSSLEVKTESDTPLLHLLVVVTHVNGFFGDRVNVGFVGLRILLGACACFSGYLRGVVLGLPLVVIAHRRERKIERTHKYQEHRYDTGDKAS